MCGELELSHSLKLAVSPGPLKMSEGRKRKSLYELYEKKRKASEERNKIRVFLGDCFTRWRALKTQVGLPTDASVAKFLLDR